MSRHSQGVFTQSTRRVNSPLSRRRTHRLMRFGLICAGIAFAAVALMMAAFRS